MSQRNLLLFAGVGLLFVATGVFQSWNLSLQILNIGILSAIMALGVNMQWGYAGLFSTGIMGSVALGGLAVVLVSGKPVPEGWAAGGPQLLLALAFLTWTAMFAGSQIAAQAAQLSGTVEAQALRLLAWLESHGMGFKTTSFGNLFEKVVGGVGQITSAVGGVIGGFTTAFLIAVMAIYFAAEPKLYRRGFAWLLDRKSVV